MFMGLFFIIVFSVYIVSFKNDFTEEHVNNLLPCLILVIIVYIVKLIFGLAGD